MDREPIIVLVVEDDVDYVDYLRDALRSVAAEQFELRQVSDIEEALSALKSFSFDLALLDLNLPPSRGIETFNRLRERAPTTPILVLTRTDDETVALAAVRAGAQDYLLKSQVDGKTLARALRYAIERKRVEDKLREREEFFRLISENVSDLIAVLAKDGTRLYNSPSYKQVLGDSQNLQGTDSLAEIHPEDFPRVKRIFAETVATGIGQRAEFRFLRKDGTVRHVESIGNVVKDENGQTSKVVVVSRDITERKQAEEALRVVSNRLMLATRAANVGIFDWDIVHDHLVWDDAMYQIYGVAPDHFAGAYEAWESGLHPDDRQAATAELQMALRGDKDFDTEFRVIWPDQSVHHIKADAIVLRNNSGQPVQMLGMNRDITGRKVAEETLRHTLAELKKSHEQLQTTQMQLIQAAKMESVGTLAAGVAHEVKNPLQTIQMGIDFLDRNTPRVDQNVPMVLAEMLNAVRRADKIVRGLLDYSTAHELEQRPQDINTVLERSLELVRFELVRGQIEVQKNLDPALPLVAYDRNKMEQVFINLFMNAVHAMNPGGILSLHTAVRRWPKVGSPPEDTTYFQHGDEIVLIEIEDTGSGIPEDLLERVFDPFVTTKPTGVGTGLGLAVTRNIISLHGGNIAIANRPEGGARVTIWLKACEQS